MLSEQRTIRWVSGAFLSDSRKRVFLFLSSNGSSSVCQTFRKAKEQRMRSLSWHPPVELSCMEQTIIQRIKRAKLFVFLRERRHKLF